MSDGAGGPLIIHPYEVRCGPLGQTLDTVIHSDKTTAFYTAEE